MSDGPDQDDRMISRAAVARYLERYAKRVVNGPAIREYTTPINRNRYDPEQAELISTALRTVASGIRNGFEPESDWPQVQLTPGQGWNGETV